MQVGDHIERLDGQKMVDCRHYEVAKALKEIPKDSTFILRLVEPLSSGFGEWRKNYEVTVHAPCILRFRLLFKLWGHGRFVNILNDQLFTSISKAKNYQQIPWVNVSQSLTLFQNIGSLSFWDKTQQ